ncbi:hypothetical protein HZA87_01695 [Candidatus Uhrbacteria bacterium]|nr:hypothetical protein [Candidatus Uhrbacteria bacterium]
MKTKQGKPSVPLMMRATQATSMRALALPPTVIFAQRAMEDMRILVAICDKEVGWLGTAKRVDREFFVQEIFLPKQHAGSAHTTITTEGLGQLMDELTKAGRASVLDRMFFWGHSHADMVAEFSAQDDLQMDKLASHAPWFIRAVLNKRGHMQVDVYLRQEGMSYLNVPWIVHAPVQAKRLDYWQAQVASHVTHSEPRIHRVGKGLPLHLRSGRFAEFDGEESRHQAQTEAEWQAMVADLQRKGP